ncbi:hypothetical protein [Methylorubrum extorquens]|nr:hypothetical protein [Methylorubrum extorquens]
MTRDDRIEHLLLTAQQMIRERRYKEAVVLLREVQAMLRPTAH